jgi:hypothetical protein
VTVAPGSDRPTLLVTVRHPGPAACVAVALPALASAFDVVVLSGEPERARMERELGAPAVRHVPASADGLVQLTALLATVDPGVCLRTTPAGGDGPDEWLGTALGRRGSAVPVVALQDDYGVGRRLEDADAIATVDPAAVDLLDVSLRSRATVIGRVAHDGFATGASPAASRREGRRRLGLGGAPAVLHLTGAGPSGAEVADLRAVLTAAGRTTGRAVTLVRPHPRLEGAGRAACRRLVEQAGSGRAVWADAPSADRSWLVVADVIVSARSSMNIDSLAFQSVTGDCLTASLYFRGAVFATSAGPAPEARGSFVAGPDDLAEILERALHDDRARARRMADARGWLRPDGLAAARLLALVQAQIEPGVAR